MSARTTGFRRRSRVESRKGAHAIRCLGAVCVVAMAMGCASEVAVSSQSEAIIGGEADGDDHPYVGLMLAYGDILWPDGTPLVEDIPLWLCSGTAISERVYLTAAHCTASGWAILIATGTPVFVQTERAAVWFAPDEATILGSGFPFTGWDAMGTAVPHPGWGTSGPPNTYDVGLVVLDEGDSFGLDTYGTLAPRGFLDAFQTSRRNSAYLVGVGYGLQANNPGTGTLAELNRKQATSLLANMEGALTDGFNIQSIDAPRAIPSATLEAMANDENHVFTKAQLGDNADLPDSGGSCFGDSGGPQLIDGRIVAVTSFGLNNLCQGTSFHYRVDRSAIYDWIESYL